MRYKKMSFISGIVIFFSFIMILAAILWLADKRIFFTHDYKIFVKFANVVGLRDHSQVYMRGYRVGWTKGVTFERDGVLIRVDVKKKYKIPVDSKFEINTLNFMGEKAITITPGKSNKYLKPGDIVWGKNKDLMIQAKEILTTIQKKIKDGNLENKAEKLSKSLDLLYSSLNKINNKIDKLNIENYNKQIKKIGDAGKELSLFLNETKNDIKVTTRKGRESLVKLNDLLDSLSKLSKKLNGISDKLNRGEGSAGKLLQDKKYIENLNSTIEELRKLIEDIKKNGLSSIETIHMQYNKTNSFNKFKSFPLGLESDGTQKLLALTAPIIETLQNGEILVIDELDNSLHTELIEAIIKLFNSKETNPNSAQLIFTTHDTNLLNQELFRRDQIWFTQKDIYGASELYSLVEYGKGKTRDDLVLEKNYLSGKFGAVPYIESLNYEVD